MNRTIAWLAVATSLAVAAAGAKEATMTTLKGRKVLMVIASQNFRDEEFTEPCELLKAAGAEVCVASSRKAPARGMLGKVVTPDRLLTEVRAADYDAVIFVGGTGAEEYFGNPTALQLAKEAAAAGKVVAAICIAPAILANAGVLQGKTATCFPSVAEQLRKGGATLRKQGVVRDGRTITADGPQSARAFARELAAALEGSTT